MNNEEKILSMLDVIARQVTILTETTATKGDLQRVRAEMATKEELQAFRVETHEEFLKVRNEMATKEELQAFRAETHEEFLKVRNEMATKEELQAFRAETHEEFLKVRNEMVTKNDFLRFQEQVHERFDRSETENTRAHEAILAKIDEQSRAFDAKFDVLNDRVFDQEAELRVLKKRAAL